MGSWAFDAAGFKHGHPNCFAIYGLDRPPRRPSIPEYMAFVHPEDRESLRKMQKMLADHHGFDFTKRIVRPMERFVTFGVSASGGTEETVVGTGCDVTGQEQLTGGAAQSEVELRQILDLAPQIIAVWDPNASASTPIARRSRTSAHAR